MSEIDIPTEDWLVHFNRERLIIERERLNKIEEITKNGNDKTLIPVSTEISGNIRPIQHPV